MGCVQSAPIEVQQKKGNCNSNKKSAGSTKTKCCGPTTPKANFTYRKDTCALEYWEPIQSIGEGSISSIHLVRRRPERIDVPYKEKADIMRAADHRRDQEVVGSSPSFDINDEEEVFALKSIMKDHVRNDKFLEEMRGEIYTMSRLCHDNIVNVYEAFERKRHIYLVLEYCRGGDLVGRSYTEAEAAMIVRKILLAVAYMHQQKVVHRDLKLENVVFDRDPKTDPNAEIKIIDFGLATKFLSNEYKNMTARVGTLYSMSPQVLQGVYDKKCDIWSIGVIAYILLSGNKPFWGPPREISWEKRKKIMIDRIMRCEYMKMIGPSWKNISKEAKQFIESTLEMDPYFRPSAERALKHPWIVKFQHYKPAKLPVQNEQHTKKMQIKRLLQPLIAQELLEDEIVTLKTKLGQHDPNREDKVTLENLRHSLLEAKLSPDKVQSMFEGVNDTMMQEKTNYVGLLNDALDRKRREQEELIQDVFQQCAPNDNQCCCKISKAQLRKILDTRQEISKANLKTILDVIAEAGDGLDGNDDEQQSISCQQVVDRLKTMEMRRMEIICSCREEGQMEEPTNNDDDDDDANLVDETNAVIPGGKRDPNAEPVWIYDASSKSVRKFRAGEDGLSC